MVQLLDNQTGAPLGNITAEQLQFLVDQLVEESQADADYYIDRDTIAMLEEQGADPQLTALLLEALGQRDEMEIRWTKS